MSIKSKLAKVVPNTIAEKQAMKGSYRGDNWDTVGRVIQAMCEIHQTSEDTASFIYEGKEIGWARANGLSWIDPEAYTKIRHEYAAQLKARKAAMADD